MGDPDDRQIQRDPQEGRTGAKGGRGARTIPAEEAKAAALPLVGEALGLTRVLRDERGEATVPAHVVRLAAETARRVGVVEAPGEKVRKVADAPVVRVQKAEEGGVVEAEALRCIGKADVLLPRVATGAGAMAPGREALVDESSVRGVLGAPSDALETTMGDIVGEIFVEGIEKESGGRRRVGGAVAATDRDAMLGGLRLREGEAGTASQGEVVGVLQFLEQAEKTRLLQGAQQRAWGLGRSCCAASGRRSSVARRSRKLGETT